MKVKIVESVLAGAEIAVGGVDASRASVPERHLRMSGIVSEELIREIGEGLPVLELGDQSEPPAARDVVSDHDACYIRPVLIGAPHILHAFAVFSDHCRVGVGKGLGEDINVVGEGPVAESRERGHNEALPTD